MSIVSSRRTRLWAIPASVLALVLSVSGIYASVTNAEELADPSLASEQIAGAVESAQLDVIDSSQTPTPEPVVEAEATPSEGSVPAESGVPAEGDAGEQAPVPATEGDNTTPAEDPAAGNAGAEAPQGEPVGDDSGTAGSSDAPDTPEIQDGQVVEPDAGISGSSDDGEGSVMPAEDQAEDVSSPADGTVTDAASASTLDAETAADALEVADEVLTDDASLSAAADEPGDSMLGDGEVIAAASSALDEASSSLEAPAYATSSLAAENASGGVLANGTYYLVASNYSGILFPTGSSASVVKLTSLGNKSQQWNVKLLSDGHVSIVNATSGKALTMNGGKVSLTTADPSKAEQMWAPRKSGGTIELVSATSSDLASPVTLSTGSATWYVIPASTQPSAGKKISDTSAGAVLLNALARGYSGSLPAGTYNIVSPLNGARAIEVADGSGSNGANVRLFENYGSSLAEQQWVVSSDSYGYITLTRKGSSKVIDVSKGAKANGTNIQQWDYDSTARAQKWIAVANGDGTYVLHSALDFNQVLDLAGASTKLGANIQTYRANGTAAQSWRFTAPTSFAAANTGTIAPGTWYIATKLNTGMLVDVAGASKSNGANIQLYSANMSDAQAWIVTQDSNGYLTFKSKATGKVLDVAGGKKVSGTNVQQWALNTSALAQKWVAVSNGDGSFTLHSALNPRLVLDLSGASATNGRNIQVYTTNGTNAQRWMARTQDQAMDSYAARMKSTLGNGEYYVRSGITWAQMLDLKDGSSANGANVRLWDSNLADAQCWIVSHDSQGYVTLTNKQTGKVLDVTGASRKAGANVQQYASNGTRAQKWIAVKNSNGTITLISALSPTLVLDVAGGSGTRGTNVQLWTRNGATAQMWRFVDKNGALVSAALANKSLVSDGNYYVTSAANGSEYLDVAAGSVANGANIALWGNTNSMVQVWTLTHDNDGYVSLTNANSGKMLTVNGSAANGTNVTQSAANASKAQKWVVIPAGSGTFKLVSALSPDFILSVNGSAANGANVQINTDGNKATQQWKLVRTNVESAQLAMRQKVQGYSSNTSYIVMVDRAAHRVGVYEGSWGAWNEIRYIPCTLGAYDTPTPTGIYSLGTKLYYFDSENIRVFYATGFIGTSWLFHSVIYARTDTPQYIVDGRLGMNLSHGCIRLSTDDAYWMYTYMPAGSKVVIYN